MRLMTYSEKLRWNAASKEERRKMSRAAYEVANPGRKTAQKQVARSRKKADRLRRIAVLDFETDPFDREKETYIYPFLAILYSDQFEPVIIWDESFTSFVSRVVASIEALPEPYTIYAHNGGRFDYYFILNALRGRILMKGRSIMQAKIGPHTLRDSWHILPTKLAAFQKDKFDYDLMKRETRQLHREKIIAYCLNDTRYTFDVVKAFLSEFGFRLTIGQASLALLKQTYEFGTINENLDARFRRFYTGARVECFQGAGLFEGDYKIFDVNSMYPFVMAHKWHPLNAEDIEFTTEPNEHTFFLRLRCRNRVAGFGAFVSMSKIRALKYGFDPATCTGELERGEFFVTIHEYEVATRLGLISNVEFLECIGFPNKTTFADFILPLYTKREVLKRKIDALEAAGKQTSQEYIEAVRWSLFYKLLMNNAYGKFAQDPRKFTEKFMCEPGAYPEYFEGLSKAEIVAKLSEENWNSLTYYAPETHSELFTIWERPQELGRARFNNVAIGASITGAARAQLLEGIYHATDLLYCDTDSLICRDLNADGLSVHATNLGAWKPEGEFDQIAICGKKLYACRNTTTGKQKRVAKGLPSLQWDEYCAMLRGEEVSTVAFGPTLFKDGTQQHLKRVAKLTTSRKA